MPNIVLANTPIFASGEKFHAIWKLTRGMLAAGWKYKTSGDALEKDITLDPSKDLWSVGGYTNLTTVPSQTGTAASITVPLVATGTTPPALTLTGTPNSVYDFVIQITTGGARGTAVFKWSSDGGNTFTSNVTTAATNSLGGTGITANWPVGTYTNDNQYVLTNTLPTVTGLTGMVANSVGHALTISGCATTQFNGSFRIASLISSTSVTIYNPYNGLTAYTFADAANGSITWSEQDGGGAASITALTNGIATVTGLTGMTTSSVGHLITFNNAASSGNNGTFMVVSFVSATSVKINNAAAVAGDANNGSITWTERDPSTDLYPPHLQGAFGLGAWINLQGPSTMKIPIGTNTPIGTFIRGEKVTQAVTGCEGEIIGVVTDTTGGTGFVVIVPRVNGSGAGPRGWDTSTITAVAAPAGSGASVSPSATAIEYIRELVFWKDTATLGHTYYQCIDQNLEAVTTATTGRFSTMATTLAGVTFTVPPGGSTGTPLANGFPVIGTMCCMGTGGSGAAGTGAADLFGESGTTPTGNIQVVVANNIEATGSSQDGSWTLAVGTSAQSPGTFTANCFMRLDDTEDGDVDPYVLFYPTATAAYGRSRTTSSALASGTDFFNTNIVAQGTVTSYFQGWRRRGFATGDAYQEFGGFALNTGASGQSAIGGGGQTSSFGYPDAIANTFVSPAPRVREPIWIVSINVSSGQPITTGIKMRKGTMRWWYMVCGGSGTDTLDSKKWVQGGTGTTSATVSPIVFGPWDGVTVPLNA